MDILQRVQEKFGNQVREVEVSAANFRTPGQDLATKALAYMFVMNLIVALAFSVSTDELSALQFLGVLVMMVLIALNAGIGMYRRGLLYRHFKRKLTSNAIFGIWLRRFSIDNNAISAGHNIEDKIARIMNFPLIAIDNVANPNTSGGAVRLSVNHSCWKEVVSYLSSHSAFIILYVPRIVERSMSFEIDLSITTSMHSDRLVILLFESPQDETDMTSRSDTLERLSAMRDIHVSIRDQESGIPIAGLALTNLSYQSFFARHNNPIGFARMQASWVKSFLRKVPLTVESSRADATTRQS